MRRRPLKAFWLALFLSILFLTAACRLADAMVQFSSHPPTPVRSARASKTATPTATTTVTATRQRPTATRAPTQTEIPTELPTETEFPTDSFDTLQEFPTDSFVEYPTDPLEPTETPVPTREFKYAISKSWCGPNWQTFIEGRVTEDGYPVDGLYVRISLGPDRDPAWTDYVTGTDPTKPGGYTLIIDANRPHEGLWYVWLVDPETQKRISDISIVKTDPIRVEDTEKSPGSCQSATVNFVADSSGDYRDVPTPTQTRTPRPTRTGTPPTATPTRTETPVTPNP